MPFQKNSSVDEYCSLSDILSDEKKDVGGNLFSSRFAESSDLGGDVAGPVCRTL